MRTAQRLLAIIGLIILIALFLPNTRSLYEGLGYLRDVATYSPTPAHAINPTGRYAALFDLVRFRNAERLLYLRHQLDRPGITVTSIAIPNSQFVNLWVRFNDSSEPLTIFSAHYDKLRDDPNYQGASDNTAAVSVLLASILTLAQNGNAGNRAFLLTGEEETGLRGATAFVEYAHANHIAIRAIVNFDNLGRGALMIRPSAQIPGFVFTLPLIGDFAFDGQTIRPSPAYDLANAQLAQKLARAQPSILVSEKFTAVSDSNVFQAQGIATVMISGSDMYYLEQTWHTYADRIELLDEQNLDAADQLIEKMP